MFKLFIAFILLVLNTTTQAENKSILGIDYLKKTGNKIIAEAMLEMEPALIEYYKKGEWVETTKADRVYVLNLKAYVLGQDRVSEDNYQVISKVAPEVPLKFLKLDKEKYPNLWHFGNVMRLTKEENESRWLYKALHGKEYKESR